MGERIFCAQVKNSPICLILNNQVPGILLPSLTFWLRQESDLFELSF